MMTVHQTWLERGGREYLYQQERQGWVEGNKEGLAGLLGYSVIYLMGQAVRQSIDSGLFSHRHIVCLLLGYGLLSQLTPYCPISRRTYSATYICWVLWFNCLMLSVFWAMQNVLGCT